MLSECRNFDKRALAIALCFLTTFVACTCFGLSSDVAFAQDEDDKKLFEIDPKNFDNSANIDNQWWPMKPGTQFTYEGYTVEDDEKIPHRVVFTVTDLTKVIHGVRTVVVFDRDYTDGRLEEAELAFFAQDNDGNVWHLGEYSEVYDETELIGGRMWVVGHLEDAKAGIMMKSEPQLGTPS